MIAVILAAGAARRLAPLTDKTQKCLLSVGGRPILAHMLDTLQRAGIREAALVVGHCADQVRAAALKASRGMRVRVIENPDYAKGSLLSLYAARDILRDSSLIMDADVVFPREFLRRLLTAPAPSALLVDRGFHDTGEEVKVYTRGDRVIALGTKLVPEAWDAVGEGVGFFKCGAEAGPELLRRVEQVLREGGDVSEYEDALHPLVTDRYVGAVDVTGLPWTEVDFVEDLQRANTDVWPRVVRLDGT